MRHGAEEKLPRGWALAVLGDLVRVRSGYAFKSADYCSAGVPLLRQSNLGEGVVDLNDAKYLPEHYLDLYPNFLVKHGDMLIGMSGSIGKISVFKHDTPALQNQRTGLIECGDGETKQYVRRFYELLTARLDEKSKGVGIQNISHNDIEAFAIPVPPRAEMKRINSKIDELFSRIEEGERALERVQTLVLNYRQAVLKAAVTGQLTRDWREQHKDQLESGEALLHRILEARREAWKRAELKKMKAKGVKPGNDKWMTRYEEPLQPDSSHLTELPPQWCYVNIEALVEPTGNSIRRGPFGSALTKSIFVPRGYKVYEQQHVIGGDFNAGSYYITAAKYKELASFRVRPGDLLITCSGTVGRVVVVPPDAKPGVINQALLRLTLDSSVITADYFMLAFKYRLAAFSSRGTGMNNFSGVEELKKMAFPLPPLSEQRQIVEAARQHFSTIDHQEHELAQQGLSSNALRQATLRDAFRGKLVAHDASDEPAAALIERIAAERAKRMDKARTEDIA